MTSVFASVPTFGRQWIDPGGNSHQVIRFPLQFTSDNPEMDSFCLCYKLSAKKATKKGVTHVVQLNSPGCHGCVIKTGEILQDPSKFPLKNKQALVKMHSDLSRQYNRPRERTAAKKAAKKEGIYPLEVWMIYIF
jgi:hypothetical protein